MINTTMPAPARTLRERMIEDMKVHRLCRTTQRNYLRDVERFAIWLGRPPDRATDEDLRRYQIEQSEMGFGAPAMNTAGCCQSNANRSLQDAATTLRTAA